MFKINKLESDVAQLRREMTVVREELAVLQSMNILLKTLVTKVSMLPEPPRESWERHSCPAWEQETLSIPAVAARIRRVSKHLALLEPPPASRIDHVTICLNGSAQYVFSYDAADRKLPYYSGWFHEVGLRVLEAAGSKEWKEAAPGSEEWNEAFQTVSA